MLQKLSIQNYAIIDKLEIEFSGGLNVITGETGAGKSIIMGALALILGERADSSVLQNKEKKSVVEGVFTSNLSSNTAVKEFFQKNDFDYADELLVRREIAVNGKSRAFINDTPVNLAQLNELSSLLVDLHQQFDTLSLGESGFQRDVLDAIAGNASLLAAYQERYSDWQSIKKEWEALKEKQLHLEKEADYNRFQCAELDDAAFNENELETIDADLKMLTHAEGIKSVLTKVYYELQESETPVVQQLKSLLQQLNNFSSYHPDLQALLQRLQAVQIELKDIADEVDRIGGQVNYDPAKIEELNERLSLGYRLQKKHGVNSTNELLEIHQQLKHKLQVVHDIGYLIAEKEATTVKLAGEVANLAGKITETRSKQMKPLEDKVNKLLVKVGMPNARLKVTLEKTTPQQWGADHIEFLFDANASGNFQPVRKVASGGELSRLMLCIKSLVAQSIELPTMIFDEIDTGISGEAARQVGLIMKELASNRQVICITHQPQIAGKADAHYFVYKETVKKAVTTNIRSLSREERIVTIAKMLSGEEPTAAAMENAREMVRN